MNAEIQAFKFRVTGWQNKRMGRLEGNRLMFEVMNLACACETCFARLDLIKSCMESSNFRWSIIDLDSQERCGQMSRILMVELEEIPENISAFLSGLLGLEIKMIARRDSFSDWSEDV